jgi:c(7)-type cytochrome triheme protein
MTPWKLISILAAALLACAVLADDLPRLPAGLQLAQSGDSPGAVTFNHDMHVDTGSPACLSCHPKHFSILGKSATRPARVLTHEAMEKGQSCGACHGKGAFDFQDCTMCHAM